MSNKGTVWLYEQGKDFLTEDRKVKSEK